MEVSTKDTYGADRISRPKEKNHAIGYFLSAAKQQVELFCLLYGDEHREGGLTALRHIRKFHDENPELLTIHFIVDSWNRLWFGYSESVRGGIRSSMRILPDSSNPEALASLALSPYGKSGKRVWRWPDVFSSRPRRGMWLGRLLPELEEKLELSRIGGVGCGRTGGSGGALNLSNEALNVIPKVEEKVNRRNKGGRKTNNRTGKTLKKKRRSKNLPIFRRNPSTR